MTGAYRGGRPSRAKTYTKEGFQGPFPFPGLSIEIVKRSDAVTGFKVLPRRWVVERTLAWLNRCRRLAKDFENRTYNALAFLQRASIRLMLRRLFNHQ